MTVTINIIHSQALAIIIKICSYHKFPGQPPHSEWIYVYLFLKILKTYSMGLFWRLKTICIAYRKGLSGNNSRSSIYLYNHHDHQIISIIPRIKFKILSFLWMPSKILWISRTIQITYSLKPSESELLWVFLIRQVFSYFWTFEYTIVSPWIYYFPFSLKRKTKKKKSASIWDSFLTVQSRDLHIK